MAAHRFVVSAFILLALVCATASLGATPAGEPTVTIFRPRGTFSGLVTLLADTTNTQPGDYVTFSVDRHFEGGVGDGTEYAPGEWAWTFDSSELNGGGFKAFAFLYHADNSTAALSKTVEIHFRNTHMTLTPVRRRAGRTMVVHASSLPRHAGSETATVHLCGRSQPIDSLADLATFCDPALTVTKVYKGTQVNIPLIAPAVVDDPSVGPTDCTSVYYACTVVFESAGDIRVEYLNVE